MKNFLFQKAKENISSEQMTKIGVMVAQQAIEQKFNNK